MLSERRAYPITVLASAGMGGLQQITVDTQEQNIKIEKSPLSTPAAVSAAKERASNPQSGQTPFGFAPYLGRGNPPAVLDSPRRRKDGAYKLLRKPHAFSPSARERTPLTGTRTSRRAGGWLLAVNPPELRIMNYEL